MKRVLLSSIALILAGLVSSSHLTASQTWVLTGSLPLVRYDHHAFLLPDGRVFVIGEGNTGSAAQAPTPTFFYDPATGSWSNGPASIQSHENSMALMLADGRIMIAGGRHNATSLKNVEIYDPVTNTWSAAGLMNRGRVHGTLTQLPNGQVLVAGGYGANWDSTAELWDPSTNTWTFTGSMAIGRWMHTATLLDNGRVLVAGGEHYGWPGGDQLSSVESYDPASGNWSPTTSMSIGRAGHRAAKLPDGRVIVISGLNGGPNAYTVTPTTEIFDPTNNAWLFGASMGSGRMNSPALVKMSDDTLMMIGGQIALNPAVVTSSVERYNPFTNTWSAMPSMSTPRQYHTATLLGTGEVLVSGGYNGVQFVSSAERFVTALPVTTALVAPQPNGAGWNKTNVTVSLDATVAVGAIQSITYLFTGPQSGGATVFATHAEVPITAEGSTVVQFHSNDDGGGIEADHSITVKIDKTAPLLSVPNNITTTATGPGGAFVNFLAGGTDNGSGVVSTTIEPLISGQLFPIGTTHETVTVTDLAGNTSVGSFDVIVLPGDTTPPTVSLTLGSPANANGWHKFSPNVNLNANDAGGTVQSVSYTLSGAQNGSFTSPGCCASFNIFNQGVTTITYRATDSAGNTSADQSFTVRYDSQQPLINFISNITVNATSSSGATVNFPAPAATDATSGIDTITASPASGSTFPHGTTSVTVTAVDQAGNTATRNFSVTVNKALLSIAVSPSTATINEGQGQAFTALGTFTDGSQLTLPTGGGGGGGGGGNSGGGSVWNLHFDNPLVLSQCGSQASFSSQAIGGSTALPATVDSMWGPTNSVVHATGTLNASQLSLTLTCVNAQGSPGSLTANWTGTRYEGTWNFSGTSGQVTVRGWSPKTAAPTARFSIGAATVNGVVYVMGRDNPSLPSPVEAYDIATDSWSTVGTMPTSREGAAYAALNGKIYAAGGHVAGGNATSTMDVYDPSTNSWTAAAAMGVVRAQFALVAASNGKLYAIGGETGASGSPSTASVEAYDPATDTWSVQASMSAPRKFHVAGAIGSTIVVAGGSAGGSSTTEVYNVTTNTWSSGPSPSFNVEGGRAVVINGAMFVVGGTANGGSFRVQMYRPANGQSPAGWAVPGDLPTARGQLAVAAAGGSSDVLYAIGGQRNGSSLSTVEAMSTPPPNDLSVTSGGGGGGGGGFTTPVVTFTSTDTSVATMNGGIAQGNHAGETTIVATANGVSCVTTGTCATLTVVNPECATIVLTVTPVGSIPFSALPASIEGVGSLDIPFGTNQFDAEPGTYILHFAPPAGFKATPNPLTINASCSAPSIHEVFVEAEDTTPPVITVPANITTIALTPFGKKVTFAATAVDAIDGARPVTCTPASGAIFPLGTTTVTCSSADTRGNTASATFTVTVRTISSVITELIDALRDWPSGASLLRNILRSVIEGHTSAACGQLGAFINQAQAQAGKKLTQAQAAQLIQLANAARAALGCN